VTNPKPTDVFAAPASRQGRIADHIQAEGVPMVSSKFAGIGLAAAFVAILPTLPVQASGLVRTYVAANGNDMSSCVFTNPCGSISRALSATVSGGTVSCIDSGEFLNATITISVTIDCAGTSAELGSLTINGAGILVTLKNLTIAQGSPTGITYQEAAGLILDNVRIITSSTAISVTPTTAAKLVVSNSVFGNNSSGVVIKPGAGGSVFASFDHVTIANSTGGGMKTDTTSGPITVDISNSTVGNNAGNGMNAVGGAGGPNMLSIKNSVIAASGAAGIQANGSTAAALVNNTLLDSNASGATAALNGGRVLTYGNNSIVGTAGSGFTGSVPLQ
jgi:hypothetical protein